MADTTNQGNTLSDRAAADLARSGLIPDNIPGFGLADPARIGKDTDEKDAGGYYIPYYGLDGTPVMDNGKPFVRTRRFDNPAAKYKSPAGSANHVYVPAGLATLLDQLHRQAQVRASTLTTHMVIVVEGEKKAIAGVRVGLPCIALPGVHQWTDAAAIRRDKEAYAQAGGNPADLIQDVQSPVNPELLTLLLDIKARCPSIGVLCVLFDSDGCPISEKMAFTKAKDGTMIPRHGIDWQELLQNVRYAENVKVYHAGATLVRALREQSTARMVTVSRFCPHNTKDDAQWAKQGLDDWLLQTGIAGVRHRLREETDAAHTLWGIIQEEPLFGCNVPVAGLGTGKGCLGFEVAFDHVLDAQTVGVDHVGLIHRWVGSHWQAVGETTLLQAAHRLVDAFYSQAGSADKKVAAGPKYAESSHRLYPIPDALDYPPGSEYEGGAIIPLLDTTLAVSRDGTITPMVSSRKHGLRHVIGVNWADIHQPCPRFDRFVHEVLPDPDVRRLVQQYVGYTLIGDTRYQVGQWWIGAGSNGKGVLALLVSALHRKTAAVSLDDLHGFGLESALAASLITVDETPPQIDEQRLKTLISGDEIVINRKFMRAVTARFRAKWLVRGNLPPALRDHSNGAWRRWHIIPFTAEFGPGQQEPGLADYMIQHELAGILRWALDGLVMLLKAGGFKDTPEAVQQATRAMQAQTDSVAAWFEDADIRFNDDKQTPKDTVYAGYVGWCKSNGMLPVASNKFWDRLSTYAKRHGQALVMSRPRAQGRRGVTNLDLGGDEADEQGQPDRVAVVVPFRKPPTSDPVPVVQPDAALEGFVDLDEDDLDAAPVVQTGPLTADTIKVPEFAAHHTGGIIPRRPPKLRPDGSGGVR